METLGCCSNLLIRFELSNCFPSSLSREFFIYLFDFFFLTNLKMEEVMIASERERNSSGSCGMNESQSLERSELAVSEWQKEEREEFSESLTILRQTIVERMK